MQFLILYELAQRTAPRFYIAGDLVELLSRRVELRQNLVGLFIELLVGDQFAEGSLPGAHVGDDALNIIGRAAQIIVKFWVVEEAGDCAVTFANARADVLKLQDRAVEIHVERIIVQQLADGALTLIDVVHQLLKLFADGVELYKDIARAREDLRQSLLVRAGDLTVLGYRLRALRAGGYVYNAVAEKPLLSQDGLRISPNAALDFFGIDHHNDDDWFFVFAGWDGAELDAINFAHVLARQSHLVALLKSVGCSKAGPVG